MIGIRMREIAGATIRSLRGIVMGFALSCARLDGEEGLVKVAKGEGKVKNGFLGALARKKR